MSSKSLGRVAALFAAVALAAVACAPHQPTSPPIPLQQTSPTPPAPTTTVVPLGTGLVPSLDAPAVPRGPVVGAPVIGNTVIGAPLSSQLTVQPGMRVVAAPVYAPPTAQPRGVAPSDPAQYVTTATIGVTGRVVSISVATGSFLLQTPSEAWTVVLPAGASAPSVANGRTLTVTGYAHRSERNQLLATSISP